MAKYQIVQACNMVEAGFGETYWADADTLSLAGTLAVQLGTLRTPLMNTNTFIKGWRITPYTDDGLPDPLGRGHFFKASGTGLTGQQPAPRDVAATGLQIDFSDSTNRVSKVLFLRGLPDSSIAYRTQGDYDYLGALDAVLNPYLSFLKAGKFFIRVFERNPNPNPPRVISSFDTDTDGNIGVNFTADMPDTWQPGKRIKIRGYKGDLGAGVNGLTRIIDRTGIRRVLIDKAICQLSSQEDIKGNGALAFLEKYAFFPIANAIHGDPVSRRAGRPFGSPRGRRSKKLGFPVTHAVV